MEHIISKFISTAEIGEMKPFGNGHINDTYVVSDREGTPRWILQRVNHLVFPRIEVLQRNVAIVSDTMRERLEAEGDPEAERKYLYFFPNLEEPEKNYYYDGENYWRVCRFIPESMSMSELTPTAAHHAGAAFGQFEEILSVIPEGRLGETIENFHSMPFRLQQLRDAVAQDADQAAPYSRCRTMPTCKAKPASGTPKTSAASTTARPGGVSCAARRRAYSSATAT